MEGIEWVPFEIGGRWELLIDFWWDTEWVSEIGSVFSIPFDGGGIDSTDC